MAPLAVLFVFVGCPEGDDDDDTVQDCSGDHYIGSESQFEAIAHCESIEGQLWFDGLPWLTSIGMPALTSVGDWLFIRSNDQLADLDGLSSLTTVDLDVFITANDCLSQYEAEAFAAGLDVGGEVAVVDNGANYPCD